MLKRKDIKLQLTLLHPSQRRVIEEAKRFNVVCCGRRWGKTFLGMDRLIRAALEGKPVAWFAPNYRLLSDVWRKLQKTLRPIVVKVNEQERRLELLGGGVIEMWSLDGPDAGRGRGYALVVIDEAALVSNLEQVWQQTIRPMLLDLEGEAWFLSTPKGMNYFKSLFDLGQDSEQEEWVSWQMPTGENPRMKPSEIEAARRGSRESAFNQEYLALFLEGEGTVFQHVVEAATIPLNAQPEAGHDYVIGCDWGRASDWTVFMVVDITAGAVVDMKRSNKVDYTTQCGRLKALCEKWNPLQIIAEQNGIGQPIIEHLVRDGLPVESFLMTNASKARLIDALAFAFERSNIQILDHPVLISELVAYQAEVLRSGLTRYSAPSGQHDDTVMALAMAWTAVYDQGRLVYAISDEDFVVPDFEIPAHWRRAYGIEVRWNKVAVIWGAREPESDKVYIYAEYLLESEGAAHAAKIRSLGDWIPGLMDPAANGRERADGLQRMRDYRKLGLQLQGIDNKAESGIESVRQLMLSGQLKVFASLEKLLRERKLYRFDQRGQIVRRNDNLMDALRCLVNGRSRMRTKPMPDPYFPPQRHYGERSWMV